MDPVIHYIKEGRSFGPVPVRDFLDMLSQGVVGPDDLVRVEGDGRWKRASVVAEQIRTGNLTIRPPEPRPATKRPSGMPPGGSHTVFTSAPPIPKAALPRELAGLGSGAPSCPKCREHAKPDALFCKSCGARIAPRACPGCRHENDADARFCEQCGTRLEPAPAA